MTKSNALIPYNQGRQDSVFILLGNDLVMLAAMAPCLSVHWIFLLLEVSGLSFWINTEKLMGTLD